MRDSYQRFFDKGYISKDQFFDFAMREAIYAKKDSAKRRWEELKERIHGNQQVHIRKFGRSSDRHSMYSNLYKVVLNNENVTNDRDGNFEPTSMIRDVTGYSKTESSAHKMIRNYQVSHIFARTKNVYAFTAPWNIVYLPIIIDPFTGHQANGEMVDEFKHMFRNSSYLKFKDLIDDYNHLISDTEFRCSIDSYLKELSTSGIRTKKDKRGVDALIRSVNKELTPILPPNFD